MMPITYLGFSKRTYALIYELEMIFKKFLSGHIFSINQIWFSKIEVKIDALNNISNIGIISHYITFYGRPGVTFFDPGYDSYINYHL